MTLIGQGLSLKIGFPDRVSNMRRINDPRVPTSSHFVAWLERHLSSHQIQLHPRQEHPFQFLRFFGASFRRQHKAPVPLFRIPSSLLSHQNNSQTIQQSKPRKTIKHQLLTPTAFSTTIKEKKQSSHFNHLQSQDHQDVWRVSFHEP